MITIEEILQLIYEYQIKHNTEPVCIIIHPDNLEHIISKLKLEYSFCYTNYKGHFKIQGIRVYRSLDVEIGAVVVS